MSTPIRRTASALAPLLVLLVAACSADRAKTVAPPTALSSTAVATSSVSASSSTTTPSAPSSTAPSSTAPSSTAVSPTAPSSTAPAASAAAAPVADCVDTKQQAKDGVTFTTPSGLDAPGLIVGDGKRGIVFANMADTDLCDWLPYAEGLAGKGYRVAVFNYSGDASDNDVVAAATELRKRGVTSLVLVGASMGGTSVISAASKLTPAPDAIVSLSGPTSHDGVDAKLAAPHVTAPAFIAAGEFDEPYADDAHTLHKALTSKQKTLKIVSGSGAHGTALLGDSELSSAMEAFIAAHSK